MSQVDANQSDLITWEPVFEMNLDSDWGFSWCIRDNNGRLIADMPDAFDSEATARLICDLFNNQQQGVQS